MVFHMVHFKEDVVLAELLVAEMIVQATQSLLILETLKEWKTH